MASTLKRGPHDGVGYHNLLANPPDIGIAAGWKQWHEGQTTNVVVGNVANQPDGTVALPALASGATGTVTITNSLIAATSRLWLQVKIGTTTASAGAVATVLTSLRQAASGSCVVDVTNLGSAATLSTDYVVHYWIIG